MSRSWCRVKPADEQILVPVHVTCPECGRVMRIRYSNHRAIVSLRGLVRVRLRIRRCETRTCGRYHQAWRPEGEAALALPQHDGRDRADRHPALSRASQRPGDPSGVDPARRGDLRTQRPDRALRRTGRRFGRDGGASRGVGAPGPGDPGDLQPDVGHEVLWVIRECLSGLVLLARALLSAPISPACCARSRRNWPLLGFLSLAWSATASIRSGLPLARSGPTCRTSCAISITYGRPPCRSLRPTGMPRKS